MAAASPSIPLRRAYGLAMTYLGFSQLNGNQEEQAVKTLDEARAAYRSIDGLKFDDLPAAVGYAEASAWQMAALQNLGRTDEVRTVGEDAVNVAGQVLARRPGNMSALRARALVADTLASTEGFDLHSRKARALAAQGARDWEAMVALDPSNQIAWNNLASSRLGVGFWSLSLGEPQDAVTQWRAALEIERHVKEAAFLGNVLALAAGYVTMLESALGNRQAAESALAANRRLIDVAVRGLPADSFAKSFLPEFLGYYGYPTTGLWYGAYALPAAAGDDETVRREARASAKRIEQIKAANPEQELNRTRMLEVAYRTAAQSSYDLKDYAAADAEIKRALEVHRGIPVRTLNERRDESDQVMLAAMIAARLGHSAEAQGMIEPVLKFHRGLHARRDNDDVLQRAELAQALYVSALAASGQRTSQLTEAAALMDGLPAAMRQQIGNKTLRGWIAEEQKKRG
jgi:tetratricopeptide (TPR) repeat protein